MTEEWRDVVGWEGRYEVSSIGNVRPFSTNDPNIKSRYPPLKKLITGRGRVQYRLSRNAVWKPRSSVH